MNIQFEQTTYLPVCMHGLLSVKKSDVFIQSGHPTTLLVFSKSLAHVMSPRHITHYSPTVYFTKPSVSDLEQVIADDRQSARVIRDASQILVIVQN